MSSGIQLIQFKKEKILQSFQFYAPCFVVGVVVVVVFLIYVGGKNYARKEKKTKIAKKFFALFFLVILFFIIIFKKIYEGKSFNIDHLFYHTKIMFFSCLNMNNRQNYANLVFTQFLFQFFKYLNRVIQFFWAYFKVKLKDVYAYKI